MPPHPASCILACLAALTCLPLLAQTEARTYHAEITGGWVILVNESPKPIEAYAVTAKCWDSEQVRGEIRSAYDLFDSFDKGPVWSAGPGGSVMQPEVVEPWSHRVTHVYLVPNGCEWKAEVDAVLYADGTYGGGEIAARGLQARRDGILTSLRLWAATDAGSAAYWPALQAIQAALGQRKAKSFKKSRCDDPTPTCEYWEGRYEVDASFNSRTMNEINQWKQQVENNEARAKLEAVFPLPPALAQEPDTPRAAVLKVQTPAPHPTFDSFEVATIKPVESSAKSPRYITMQGTHRFVEKDYTLKLLIAAAYNLSPQTVSGGPGWIESDHFDITAVTPGDVQPTRDEQMSMLRNLLADRFKLTFHREQRQFSLYEIKIAKSGSKLKPSTAPADQAPLLVSTVYPQKVVLPARNATLAEFASILQRAVLDRPVVDKTGLAGRFDFDLEWAPDDSQFDGDVKPAADDSASAPFFTAVQEQLGLKLVAAKGPVSALVIDQAQHPSPD